MHSESTGPVIESTIVQFEQHSTFLKGRKIGEVAQEIERAVIDEHKFVYLETEGENTHVLVDPTKVVALYKHVQQESNLSMFPHGEKPKLEPVA